MTIPPAQIIRSRRKTLALIVKSDGSLQVRAPLRTSKAVIQEFIEKNRGWIETRRAEALAALPAPPRRYIGGEMFPYLGTTYPLEIVEGGREPLSLEDHKFKLAVSHPYSPRGAAAWETEAASAFERWYRAQARHVLTARVEFFARQHDFHFTGIRITSARTRWGSCSNTGSLSFSWRLIQAPSAVVDYVVVHELVHTVFHNHSKRFWRKLEMLMPDYPERRRWLREHGQELLI